jgi:hypothetical protein
MKGNGDGGWSFDDIVFWLGRGKIKTQLSGEKIGQD